jgi:hypothetical protein
VIRRRLAVLGLVALLAAGCASPSHAPRTKAASSAGSRVKDAKEFVDLPRVGLPFDKKE